MDLIPAVISDVALDANYAGAVEPGITDPEDLWYNGWILEGTL